MSDRFRALRISKTDTGQTVETAHITQDQLMDGNVAGMRGIVGRRG